MKVTRNQNGGRQMEGSTSFTPDNLLQRLEDYVREEPIRAVGQAAAAGFILRFLPLRSIIMTGIRVAAPLMLLNRLWDYAAPNEGSKPSENQTRNRETASAR